MSPQDRKTTVLFIQYTETKATKRSMSSPMENFKVICFTFWSSGNTQADLVLVLDHAASSSCYTFNPVLDPQSCPLGPAQLTPGSRSSPLPCPLVHPAHPLLSVQTLGPAPWFALLTPCSRPAPGLDSLPCPGLLVRPAQPFFPFTLSTSPSSDCPCTSPETVVWIGQLQQSIYNHIPSYGHTHTEIANLSTYFNSLWKGS